jgi:hypothetical protein
VERIDGMDFDAVCSGIRTQHTRRSGYKAASPLCQCRRLKIAISHQLPGWSTSTRFR